MVLQNAKVNGINITKKKFQFANLVHFLTEKLLAVHMIGFM